MNCDVARRRIRVGKKVEGVCFFDCDMINLDCWLTRCLKIQLTCTLFKFSRNELLSCSRSVFERDDLAYYLRIDHCD